MYIIPLSPHDGAYIEQQCSRNGAQYWSAGRVGGNGRSFVSRCNRRASLNETHKTEEIRRKSLRHACHIISLLFEQFVEVIYCTSRDKTSYHRISNQRGRPSSLLPCLNFSSLCAIIWWLWKKGLGYTFYSLLWRILSVVVSSKGEALIQKTRVIKKTPKFVNEAETISVVVQPSLKFSKEIRSKLLRNDECRMSHTGDI